MTALTIYNQQFDLSPIDNALLSGDISTGTHRHYKAAILLLLASNIQITDRQELIAYTNTLKPSAKANLKAALSIMLNDYINEMKVSNKPVADIQRFLWLVDVIKDTIKVHKIDSERSPHWLSFEQVNTILMAAMQNSTRDYIVLALLLGAGLRREELSRLTFDNISQIPYGPKMKDVITLKGKGGKVRTIPIDPALANHLREWKHKVKGGRVARRMEKNKKIGKTALNPSRIFMLVRQYGYILGIEDLAPHDLRRTYGRLMYYGTNKDIMLVKELLGHSDTKTTQKYIGVKNVLDVDGLAVGGLQIAGD